jgi:hypothetical protein
MTTLLPSVLEIAVSEKLSINRRQASLKLQFFTAVWSRAGNFAQHSVIPSTCSSLDSLVNSVLED